MLYLAIELPVPPTEAREVKRISLQQHARAAGLAEDVLRFFEGSAPLLLARKA